VVGRPHPVDRLGEREVAARDLEGRPALVTTHEDVVDTSADLLADIGVLEHERIASSGPMGSGASISPSRVVAGKCPVRSVSC
jgi:hypothetical protein